jgi:hypothetical protein
MEPAHPNHSAVAKSPDLAMRTRDLDARRSAATTDLTERNYLVAAVDDALGFEPNLVPGVKDALDRLVNGFASKLVIVGEGWHPR